MKLSPIDFTRNAGFKVLNIFLSVQHTYLNHQALLTNIISLEMASSARKLELLLKGALSTEVHCEFQSDSTQNCF